MPYAKYIFKPGIDREGTDYSNEGGWYDANLVRFRKGRPEKIGGWAKNTLNTFLSTCRALHAWVNLELTKYLGLGTTWKYYVLQGNVFNDITPLRVTTSAGDVTFSATNGDATITVTDASHGAVVNDFVTFSGAATLGGLITAEVLNQEYQIATITSTNVYTIEAKDTDGDEVTANSSDSGNGGSSVVGAYQINVGLDVFVEGSGWGAGTWGAGTFGSVSAISASSQLRNWSHGNFGEDLVLNPRGGGVYYWDQSGGATTRAVAVSDLSGAILAPTIALQVLVSDIDRHVVCLGADPINSSNQRTSSSDPMFICWSDQENITDWEPIATNTAGSLRLSSGSEIIGGLSSREEILIWTDTSMYSMSYIGPPFTFGVNLINQGVGLIGPKAAVNTPDGVYWMDRKGFYKYSGSVQLVPCSVHYYVFSDFNQGQYFQTFGFVNKQFNEVGWFYCSSGETTIDRYVVYNYAENTWTIGQLSRSAWMDEGIFESPIATYTTSNVGYLYDQETGNDADGSPMDNVYIQSSDFDMHPDGDYYTFIRKVIPDVKFTGNGGSDQTINFVLKSRNFPGDSLTTDTTQTVTSTTQRLDTRIRARQLAFRIESDDDNSSDIRLGVGWRLGDTRMDVKPDGRR
jgi:hypothetical protein